MSLGPDGRTRISAVSVPDRGSKIRAMYLASQIRNAKKQDKDIDSELADARRKAFLHFSHAIFSARRYNKVRKPLAESFIRRHAMETSESSSGKGPDVRIYFRPTESNKSTNTVLTCNET
jgi:hypothetical protein